MFKFTIRDVLWLMLVVGLAAGWWMHQRSLNATIDRVDSRWLKTELRARRAEEGREQAEAELQKAKASYWQYWDMVERLDDVQRRTGRLIKGLHFESDLETQEETSDQ